MPVFDLYSKRQKASIKGDDVFQYEKISKKLKAQIVHIFSDSIGSDHSSYNVESRKNKIARTISEILCREYGLFSLVEYPDDPAEDLFSWFMTETDFFKNLDFIELCLRIVDKTVRNYGSGAGVLSADDAIEEFNQRAIEDGFGYQYETGRLIKIDSKLIHKDIIKPALALLSDPLFKNANDEYMQAHEDYKKCDYSDCVHKCAKSIETALKIICKKRKWNYSETDPAKKLIVIVCDNNLIPKYLQTHYQTFQQSLESGVPTIRNKQGGHGQGSEQNIVPQYLAQFQLNQTAALLTLLIEADKSLK